jgi:phosphate transport system protein
VNSLEQSISQLFALVSEALARATSALLNHDPALGESVVTGDPAIDDRTTEVEQRIWHQIEAQQPDPKELRHLVGILQILPELERSADLAEHIAQRSLTNVGSEMTPICRGIVQRMSEVALDMWDSAAKAYGDGSSSGVELGEDDEELDILHDRLMSEVATGAMPAGVAAQVTLLARFYERLGDHAVNLGRRLQAAGSWVGNDPPHP